MRIRDTYPEIETHFPTDHFSLPAWRAYAATISATLAGKVEADTAAYDFGRDVLPPQLLPVGQGGPDRQGANAAGT